MKKQSVALIALCLLFINLTRAQGYKIEVTVDGVSNGDVILAMYNGANKYAQDTARTDANGYAVFQKPTPLAGGLYLLISNNTAYFDFLISDDSSQHFRVHYKKNKDNTATVIYTHSPENTAFVDFQKYMGERQRAGIKLREKLQKDTSLRVMVGDSLQLLSKEEKAYTQNVATQWQGKLLGTMAKAMQPQSDIPEPNIPADATNPDSLRWVHYYQWEKNHFFDQIDFSDGRLLNTPIFQPNFEQYFSKKLIQHPDSIIPQMHTILERAKANEAIYSFCLSNLFNTYIQWNTFTINADYAIGMEAVVVDLIKNYYLKGEAPWAEKDTTFMKQIRDYAHYNENSLVGMKAHDLKLETMTGQYTSIYDIQSPYLLLIFFDTNCGHCKTEVPKLYKVYEEYRNKGLEVFCVYAQQNGPEWQKFVMEHHLDWINLWDPYRRTKFHDWYGVNSTPQVFLLNKDKTIVARRVTDDLLRQLLGLYIDKQPIQNEPEEAPETGE